MVDDDLVAAIGAQGGLDGLRDSLAGFNVTDDGSIFGIVTVSKIVSWVGSCRGGAWDALRWTDKEVVSVGCSELMAALCILPLVPGLEETRLGGPWE